MSASNVGRSNAPRTISRGSRAVSSRTPEQAQHKRNVDRKAQRAFRQRTKDYITRLEEENNRLQERCNQAETELLREISRLRADNRALAQCLENISDLASATLGGPCEDIATCASSSRHTNPDTLEQDETQAYSQPRLGSPHREEESSPSADVQLDHTVGCPDTGIATSHSIAPEARDQSSSRSTHAPMHNVTAQSPTLSVDQIRPIASSLDPLHTNDSPMMDNVTHTDCSIAMPTPHSMITVDRDSHRALPRVLTSPAVCAVSPSHLPPTCPLDRILLDFLSSRRGMIADGAPEEIVLGPTKPSVKAFLNPEIANTVHRLSAVMFEVLSTFPYVRLPEKLAFFFLMYRTMRVGSFQAQTSQC